MQLQRWTKRRRASTSDKRRRIFGCVRSDCQTENRSQLRASWKGTCANHISGGSTACSGYWRTRSLVARTWQCLCSPRCDLHPDPQGLHCCIRQTAPWHTKKSHTTAQHTRHTKSAIFAFLKNRFSSAPTRFSIHLPSSFTEKVIHSAHTPHGDFTWTPCFARYMTGSLAATMKMPPHKRQRRRHRRRRATSANVLTACRRFDAFHTLSTAPTVSMKDPRALQPVIASPRRRL